ncbi:colanic acid biosynthesis acetyltransferase WcaF [Ginsengibacter hankyongi]|uniref:Colanic acid biosynthesis acetyltransferase WcaF n=1 Tax=Ginsengibacter hankyongi TaxID=2607284 RepID=A0A5J5IA01_9BACT|nr:WcaF family extracellular polysaccharide biosynthesis acetyltransferase [Ginsengibacter hankyongi]KAA9034609.1 colanic acid biosynthesis acetyltransferase WcaF [Ginsengibacter hankyongi]
MTNLGEYDNSWYKPGHPVKRWLWYLFNILFFKTSLFPLYKFKIVLLRLFGARIGHNVLIKPAVNIKYPWFLEIGNNVWIGEGVRIDNLAMVTLGDNVCLSQWCLLLTGNHDYTKSTFDLMVKPIILEEGVWIGAGAVICGGVTCGHHAVVTVGSVATGALEPMGIYRGNPALKVKERVIQ